MNAEAYDAWTDAVASDIAAKLGPKLATLVAHNSDPLLTVEEAAQYLSVSPKTVYRLLEYGAFPRAEGLKDVRIKRSVLASYGTSKTKS